jgi:serine/threonine protein kinase
MGENELSQLNVLFEVYGLFDDDILPGFKYFPKYNSEFNQCKGIGLRKYFEENSKFEIDNVCFDLVEKLLKINPKERILSKEALEHVSFFNLFINFI